MTTWAITVEDWEAEPDEAIAHIAAYDRADADDATALHRFARTLHLGPATLAGGRTPLPTGGHSVSLSVFAHVGTNAPTLAQGVLDAIHAGPDSEALDNQAASRRTRDPRME